MVTTKHFGGLICLTEKGMYGNLFPQAPVAYDNKLYILRCCFTAVAVDKGKEYIKKSYCICIPSQCAYALFLLGRALLSVDIAISPYMQ